MSDLDEPSDIPRPHNKRRLPLIHLHGNRRQADGRGKRAVAPLKKPATRLRRIRHGF